MNKLVHQFELGLFNFLIYEDWSHIGTGKTYFSVKVHYAADRRRDDVTASLACSGLSQEEISQAICDFEGLRDHLMRVQP